MIIYKYVSEKVAKETIEKKKVLVRKPIEFNDPFDCNFYCSEKEKQRAFKLFINFQFFKALYLESVIKNKQSIFGKCNTKLLKYNLKTSADNAIKQKKYKYDCFVAFYQRLAQALTGKSVDKYSQEFEEKIEDALEQVRAVSLVGCFSLKNDSMLMWSHYAKSHSGVCIEYEVDEKDFKKVHYKRKVRSFKLTKVLEIIFGHELAKLDINYEEDETFRFAVEPIFEKSCEWKYEKEIRYVCSIRQPNVNITDGLDLNGNPALFLSMPNIKTIYVGCNMSDESIKEIKDVAGGIPILKMKKIKGKYSVKPEE